MTGKPRDPEEVIRAWLADSAPDRAPASLRETLEDATSGPAGNARSWSRADDPRFRFATRFAAGVAIIAIVASGGYILGTHGTAAPATPTTSQVWPTSTATNIRPSATSLAQSTVAQLREPGWSLVSADLPPIRQDSYQYKSPVFALESLGFIAFVPTVASQKTIVYRSADGIDWREQSSLPGNFTWVDAVTESGGRVIAVGRTGNVPAARGTAWTSADLLSWSVSTLPSPDGVEALGVAAGPAGFVAWGLGKSREFWSSTDGLAWHSVAVSGLPADASIDHLVADREGYALAGATNTLADGQERAVVWQSDDGVSWTEAWRGQTASYVMGPILKTSDGGYASFGMVDSWREGDAAVPTDILIWTSPDLIHWNSPDRVGRPGWARNFSAGPGCYVAAGAQPPAGSDGVFDDGTLGVWTSVDGQRWQTLTDIPTDPHIQVLSVTGDGKHVVIAFVDQDGVLEFLVGGGAP